MSAPVKTAPSSADSLVARWIHRAGFEDERDFILRVVQPALVGMIDGTVSSLAPIFAAAIASSSHTALLVGFSTALGAGVSMGWSEALSDTGEETGRDSAVVRGGITGGMTTLGALQAATINAATLLGKDKQFGSIEPGHYADIIAVTGDPLADIAVMYHVNFVMKGGQIIKDPAHPDRNPVPHVQ